jgi:hypothetical protein
LNHQTGKTTILIQFVGGKCKPQKHERRINETIEKTFQFCHRFHGCFHVSMKTTPHKDAAQERPKVKTAMMIRFL